MMRQQYAAVSLVALMLVGSPSWAGDTKYTLADLEALQKSEGWAELLEHLGDLPPSKRDAKWDGMAEAAAVGYLNTLDNAGAAAATAEDLLVRFPTLKKSKNFMAKRGDVGMKGFQECYQNRYGGGDCTDRLTKFVGDDKDLAFKAGKLVILQMNAAVAAPFFKKAVVGKPAGSPECKDEALQRATLAALGHPRDDPKAADALVTTDVCFAEMKEPIINELATLNSYTQQNACGVMLKKNAVQGLMKARCEDAVKKK